MFVFVFDMFARLTCLHQNHCVYKITRNTVE